MPPKKKTPTKSEIRKSLENSSPKIASLDESWNRRELISSILPKGASLTPKVSQAYGGGSFPEGSSLFSGGGSTNYHAQRPYMPEIDTPDRVQFPEDRKKANFYWRLFHKLDPFFGTAIDMYAEMIVSTFDIRIKDEESKEIKHLYEDMCETVNLVDRLRYFIREYLVLGEVIPHNFWDDELGMWSYIGYHNPDNIDVKDAPIVNMEPIVRFVPDDALRVMLSDGSSDAMELRQKLPPQFVSKVMARQPIKLSPLNCSFIARKMHPYDIRGTSLATRLWRIWMVEDAVYNSTIATFRRSASPIKVIKLGDPATGYIPDPTQEAKMLEMLARAEIDPQAWMVTNYAVNFEAWGASERAVTISKEHDTIEKVKLVALGLSKGFMTGEVSFSSVKGGLQVFLRRLLSLRQFIEATWLTPKFFRPVAEMNEFVKATPSEVNHHYRVKRTGSELDGQQLIMPEIVWKNKLESKSDQDLLDTLTKLGALGIKVSKQTIASAGGIDWEEELEDSLKEFKIESDMKANTLGKTLEKEYEESSAKPGGKPGGSSAAPPKPPSAAKPGTDKTPPGGADKAVPLSDTVDAPGGGEMEID